MFGMFNKKNAALESQLNEAQKQIETAKQALAELQAKLDSQASKVAAANAASTKAKQDGDVATKASKEDAQAKTKALAELQAQLSEKTQSASKLQTLVSKAENDLAAATNQIKATKTKHDAANKELIELRAKMDAAGKELVAAKSTATAAQQGLDSSIKEFKVLQNQMGDLSKESIDLKKIIDTQKIEITKIKAELEKAVSLKVQDKAKQDDVEQENELLLTQLMEVQEELEVFYLDKVKFEKLYQEMQVRWARLEKRYPNYVDFGSIELVAFDNLSDAPSVTWRAKDYVQGSVVFDEFVFHTILRDGQPGISIEPNAKEPSTLDSALVPKLIKPQSKEFERFVRMGQSNFGQIMAAAAIIAQLEASSWRGVELPQDFDLGFWRQSLKLLPAQLQALPSLLRYDAVKLKRELINPDYEHLWLEIKGMGLGSRTWPKFEIRLGASIVERNGFSKFPKFEIPLIDGKTKPFDSWYAESQDDNGAKLELRFSLEKQVFDTSVWSRLDGPDKGLFMRLVYAMPSILLRLEAEHVAIHRPWTSWVDLAKSAMQVIEVNRMAAQSKDLPAPESKSATAETAAVTPVRLTVPNTKKINIEKTAIKKTPTTKQGSKSATKLTTAAKKNVAKTRSKLAKKTSRAKQALPIKKVVTSKKAQSTNPSTKSVAKKIGRKK
jgi:hypothetical protein